jgi:hypothetical protein
MNDRPSGWFGCLLVLGLSGGCGAPPASPSDTGARQVVQDYFEAISRRDWPRAHAVLDAESRRRCDVAEFGRRADQFRRSLGFEPEKIHVRSCEEQGTQAVAHVIIQGRGGSRQKYKIGCVLRRENGAWGINLPRQFGQR